MADLDVPDLNVWLALADRDHQHHSRARHYWNRESLPELAFCRVTMLRWTDAWIASIARSVNARVVSFDADFATFDELRFLHLKA